MDTQALTQIISAVGFPIAAFCWSAYMIKKEREDSRAEITTERERHSSEVASLTKVITENTAVLQSLKQLIEDKL